MVAIRIALLCVHFFILRQIKMFAFAGEVHHRCCQMSNFEKKCSYVQKGDINIGAMLDMTRSEPGRKCGNRLSKNVGTLKQSEAIAYAVQTINNDPDLLPNITLGFALLDDCSTPHTAIATAVSFLPVCFDRATRSSRCRSRFHSTNEHLDQCQSSADNMEAAQCHDVVGVIGPSWSRPTVLISFLFSVASLPLISHSASSDDLSDKDLHPYFMRVVPRDLHQVQAMLHFIADQGWTYISIVYNTGPYGEKATESIEPIALKLGICIAYSTQVISTTNYTEVVADLLSFPRARVVVVFAFIEHLLGLYKSTKKAKKTGHFVWITSDAIANSVGHEYIELFKGTFGVTFVSESLPGFNDHLSTLSIGNISNPWIKRYSEERGGCSFEKGTCKDIDSILLALRRNSKFPESLVVDSVYTFAHAIHQLLKHYCPNASGPEARRCVRGNVLMQFMRHLDFMGSTGRVRFDSNGDLIGKCNIVQLVKRNEWNYQKIGMFDTVEQKITYVKPCSWEHLTVEESLSKANASTIPDSVCSYACKAGEIRVMTDCCCWECHKCRPNERVSKTKEKCIACEKFKSWPDVSTGYHTCKALTPTFPQVPDTLPVLMVSLALLAALATVAVMAAYVYFRDVKVIKAASRELSFLQIAAIFVGYATALLFQVPPTNEICRAQYVLFCISFTLLYAPMLIKAIRVYRIFQCRLSPTPIRCISPFSQVVIVAALVSVQAILCLLVLALQPPAAILVQQNPLKPLVELTCNLTAVSLAPFLGYNLCLITLCSVLAFKTHSLPDNFNESRYTSMCVSTTLVIWLAFIPTYFTSTTILVRLLLLSSALLINHTVAIIFFFLPKIYAAIYLPTEESTATLTERTTTERSDYVMSPSAGDRSSVAAAGDRSSMTVPPVDTTVAVSAVKTDDSSTD